MKNRMKTTLMALVAGSLLVSCSDNYSKAENNGERKKGHGGDKAASYIPYLKENHAKYSQDRSEIAPEPTKDANKRSIDWTINATTEEAAENLSKHITFMLEKLKSDKTPRGWDELFLLEAYMKYNHFYTTEVEHSGKDVVVSKVASTDCAYEVISAHSDAVSGDFFGKGVIDTDYSAIAKEIMNSPACEKEKNGLEIYIKNRKKTKHKD